MTEERRRIVAMGVGERAQTLEGLELFDGVPRETLVEIAARSHVLTFEDGEVVVPEGEEGLGFYVILSGEAMVQRTDKPVAALRRGDFFGEMSIIGAEPRVATVVARGELRCLGVLRSYFKGMLADNPRLAMRIVEEEGRRRSP